MACNNSVENCSSTAIPSATRNLSESHVMYYQEPEAGKYITVINYVLSFINFCTGFIAVSLNAFVVYVLVIRRGISRIHGSDLFVIGLTVSDFLTGFILIFSIHIVLQEKQDAAYVCLVQICFIQSTLLCSSLFLTLMTGDRYLKIVHPFLYQRLCSVDVYSYLATVLVYLLAFVFGFIPMTMADTGEDSLVDWEECSYVQVTSLWYRVLYSVLLFLPVVTAVLLYAQIFKVAKHQIETIAKTQGRTGQVPKGRYIKMLFTIAGLYLVFFLPPAVTSVALYDNRYTNLEQKTIFHASAIGMITNCIANPLIYAYTLPQVKNAFRHVVGLPEEDLTATVTRENIRSINSDLKKHNTSEQLQCAQLHHHHSRLLSGHTTPKSARKKDSVKKRLKKTSKADSIQTKEDGTPVPSYTRRRKHHNSKHWNRDKDDQADQRSRTLSKASHKHKHSRSSPHRQHRSEARAEGETASRHHSRQEANAEGEVRSPRSRRGSQPEAAGVLLRQKKDSRVSDNNALRHPRRSSDPEKGVASRHHRRNSHEKDPSNRHSQRRASHNEGKADRPGHHRREHHRDGGEVVHRHRKGSRRERDGTVRRTSSKENRQRKMGESAGPRLLLPESLGDSPERSGPMGAAVKQPVSALEAKAAVKAAWEVDNTDSSAVAETSNVSPRAQDL